MASKIQSNHKCSNCRKVVGNVDSICCDTCKNWLHRKCAKISVSDFLTYRTDTSLFFQCYYCKNFPCGKCNLPVLNHQDALGCDNKSCLKWFHLKCTQMNLMQYKELTVAKNTGMWYCPDCVPFPCSKLSDSDFRNLFSNVSKNDHSLYPDKCSACSRKILAFKKDKCLPCSSCNKLTHRKCCKIPLSTLNFLTRKDIKKFECGNCQKVKFPFSELSSSEICSLSFNSNFDCPCNTTDEVFKDISTLRFQFAKFIDKENEKFYAGPDPYNELEKTLALNVDFCYSTNHEFHKLPSKIRWKKIKHSQCITQI